MRIRGVFLVCLAVSCAPKGKPQNLQESDYFVIVTEGTAKQLQLTAKPPEVYLSPEGVVGAVFSLYNMGKKASMRVTVAANLAIDDPATGQEQLCAGSTVVEAGAPEGLDTGGTWSSGQIMFTDTNQPCPPCRPGACKGTITISYLNRFVSSENGAPKVEEVPVIHTYTFEIPAPAEPAAPTAE